MTEPRPARRIRPACFRLYVAYLGEFLLEPIKQLPLRSALQNLGEESTSGCKHILGKIQRRLA